MIRLALETIRRIRYLFHRRNAAAELKEEMETHLAMLSVENGPASAQRRIGNLTRWQEISHDAWGWSWLESFARDFRHGARLLVKSPGFTLAACLSLSLGLGASLGIFALTNALLLKTLPVPNPHQLWELAEKTPESLDDNFSYRMFTELETANKSGIPLFALGGDNIEVNYGNSSRNTPALIVSRDAFRILGLRAYLGRLLNPDDDLPGIPNGANCVLSYRLWQSRFHGDPAALGQHLAVGAQSFTIVGVAPPEFFGFYVGSYSDLILPIAAYAATNPAQPILTNGQWTWLNILARVPANVPTAQLTNSLSTVYPSIRRRLEAGTRDVDKPNRLFTMPVATGLSAVRQRFSEPLYVLLAMTGLILVIACANLANLLLARAVVRQRELAIRLSIGAKRGRILRQLLTENALLAALAACVSVPVYFACTRGLIRFLQSGRNSDMFLDTAPDWRLFAAAAALLLFTLLLFGFAPAWKAARRDVNTALNESSQRVAPKASFGKSVVAVQIGLSFILLLGAVLLSRSLYDLRTFEPGFRRDHLLIGDVDTTQTIHKNPDLIRFFDYLLQNVRALPGVRSAAASIVVPLGGWEWQNDYKTADGPSGPRTFPNTFENWVTPGYFETFGTPLIFGRDFLASNNSKSAHVAIVNEAFARRAFGSASPLGQQLFEEPKHDLLTIIGVVSDARYRALRDDTPPTIYRPVAQLPPSFDFLLALHLEVWTATPPLILASPIEALIKRSAPQADLDFRSFESMIDANLLYERLLTALSVAFGAIGLLLSAIGVYGLSAYSVARRIPEFGIRMALGATPRALVRLVLSEHLRPLLIGLLAGSLISLVLTRFLRAWLFGVSATDPELFVCALLLLAALALCAAFLPARRAAHLDPVSALRFE